MKSIPDMTTLHLEAVKSKWASIVSAGQEIAKVGMTGFTYLPHLHFQVFVFTGPNLWEDYQTLKVDF